LKVLLVLLQKQSKKAALEVNYRRRGSKKKVAKAKKEDTQE
jgi:hypothetical protein